MNSGAYSFVLHESRCSNNCVFCASRDFGRIDENVEREKTKIQNLLLAGHEMSSVEISGNDPIEYPDLLALVEWLRSTTPGSRIVLASHGRNLKPLIRKLRGSGVSHFVLPIYGHAASIHDAVTRTPGSFEALVETLHALRDDTASFSLTTLITPQNMTVLNDLFVFVGTFVDTVAVGVPLFSPGRKVEFAVEFGVLRPYLESALFTAWKKGICVKLRNIPRCSVENSYEAVFEVSTAPRFGYEHRKYLPGSIRMHPSLFGIVPDYLSMRKGIECQECIYDQSCSGFYESFLNAGLFKFRPVRATMK
jgi:Radical SAM superfamily